MKPVITKTLFIASLFCCASCSQQAWYEGSTASHNISCLQENNSDYEPCLNDNNHSYSEYKKARDQLKKDTTESL